MLEYEIIEFKDEIIGKVFKSRKNGHFIVLGATNILKGTHRLFLCEFTETKSKGLFRKDKILSGEIKDRYKPNVCGVACIGNVKADKVFYPRWEKMISRCYNKQCKDYKYYGEMGVKVSERWLCFEYFLEDVAKIEGYDYQKLLNNEIELDKDLFGKKLYSLDTTRWLPTAINKYMGNQTQISNLPFIIGIDPGNNKYEFQSMKNFANNHNLHYTAISRCLHGKQKKHKGWTFYYKNISNDKARPEDIEEDKLN